MEDKGLTSGRDRNFLRHSGRWKRRPDIDTPIKSLRYVLKSFKKGWLPGVPPRLTICPHSAFKFLYDSHKYW